MPVLHRVEPIPYATREDFLKSFRGKVRFDHDIEPTGGATLTTGPSA